jgi:hypothetical protein
MCRIGVLSFPDINKEMNLYNFIHEDDYESVLNFLKNEGFNLYILEGEKIDSVSNFFDEASRVLPQPEDRIAKGWDALLDNLWEWCPPGNCAILWRNCSLLMNSDMQSFMTAFDIFIDASRQLQSRIQSENRTNLILYFCDYADGFKKSLN